MINVKIKVSKYKNLNNILSHKFQNVEYQIQNEENNKDSCELAMRISVE